MQTTDKRPGHVYIRMLINTGDAAAGENRVQLYIAALRDRYVNVHVEL